MTELQKIMEENGFSKECLIEKVTDNLRRDGVNIREFNKEQAGRIVKMYAAKILA